MGNVNSKEEIDMDDAVPLALHPNVSANILEECEHAKPNKCCSLSLSLSLSLSEWRLAPFLLGNAPFLIE